MKQSILIVLGSALAALIAIPQAAAFLARSARPENDTVRESDEIRQTFKLTPGTRIEISNLRGPVDIETSNTDTAEISITRSAASRADLEKDKINIENQSGRLIIRGQQAERTSGSANTPDVRHHAKLKLPRRSDLSIDGIAGQVQVGDLEGQLVVNAIGGPVTTGAVAGQAEVSAVNGLVTLGSVGKNVLVKNIGGAINLARVNGSITVSGVNGAVNVGQVAQQVVIKNVGGDIKVGETVESLDISGINGAFSASISKLATGGVQINNVSRTVELRFTDAPGAELTVKNVPRNISIDLPNVTIQEKSASAMRARIGNGGPPISINGVSGGVHLLLDTQTRRTP